MKNISPPGSAKVQYSKAINDPNKSWSDKEGKHIPSGFAAVVVDFNGKIYDIQMYIGKDAAEKFIDWTSKICDHLIGLGKQNMKPLTREQWRIYNETKNCNICKKVKDHDHFTGEFRQVLCLECNFKLKENTFIPVSFHNLKRYDDHHIIKAVKNFITDGYKSIKPLAENSENYKCIDFKRLEPSNLQIRTKCKKCNARTKTTTDYRCVVCNEDKEKQYYSIRFLDSFAFKITSLDSAVKDLKENEGQFKIARQFYVGDFGVYDNFIKTISNCAILLDKSQIIEQEYEISVLNEYENNTVEYYSKYYQFEGFSINEEKRNLCI